MMMEETDDNAVVTDDSSHPPSFAMPPGGMQEADTQSEPETDTASDAATPAPADPFDLLSMTAAPTAPANAAAPVSGFDVFGSEPFPAAAAPAAEDLWGGGTASSNSGAIDISTQESMIAAKSSPKLDKAELGDLLGLTGPPSDKSAPPSDLPLTAPTNAPIDPFGNTDLFQAPGAAITSINISTSGPLINAQPTQQAAIGISSEKSTSPVPMIEKATPGDKSPMQGSPVPQEKKRFSFSAELAEAKRKVMDVSTQGPAAGANAPQQRSRTPPPVRAASQEKVAQQQQRSRTLSPAAKSAAGADAWGEAVPQQLPRTPPPSAKAAIGPKQTAGATAQGKEARKPGSNTAVPSAKTTSDVQPTAGAGTQAKQRSTTPTTPTAKVANDPGPQPPTGEAQVKQAPKQGSNAPSDAMTAKEPPKEASKEGSSTAPQSAKTDSGENQPPEVKEPQLQGSLDSKATNNDPSAKQAEASVGKDQSRKFSEQPSNSDAEIQHQAASKGVQKARPNLEQAKGDNAKQQAVPAKLELETLAQERFMQKQKEMAEQKASAGEEKSEPKDDASEKASKSGAETTPEAKSDENGKKEDTTPQQEPSGKATKEDATAKKDDSEPGEEEPVDESADFEADFEEVELVSPQASGELDPEAKKADEAVKAQALATGALKPPLTASSDDKDVAKTRDELAAEVELRKEQEQIVKELEAKLAAAQKEVEHLQSQKNLLEHQHRDSQEETATVLQGIQNKLQQEQGKRAEAENKTKLANHQIEKLKSAMQEREEQWEQQSEAWKQQLTGLEKENEALIAKAKHELEDRKEHERRERVLANKLNTIKKQQATKTDVEEVYEDDLRLLKEDVSSKTKQVEELQASEANLKQQLEEEKSVSQARIEQLEKAVREEKQLNEDRKKKMKAFIETKAEELKEAKEECENAQAELNRDNQSVVDLNSRWKTLHAQWVQSQTRNRELQRDLNKMKKDSENLHKVGDSLNVKLSSSAKDIEQHKNKRLAAKQELMAVLGKLEAEREITNKLRDSVRFTFTAKAQSQHQLLQEALTEFNKHLEALARRLGRPIPLTNDGQQSLSSLVMSAVDESEASEGDDAKASGTNGDNDEKNSGASKEQKRILAETARLLAKLENETQHISQGIMALSNAIEQMNTLINGGGEKTCFTSLGDIFFGGGMVKAIEADKNSHNRPSSRNVRYGHSSTMPIGGSGTMT